MKNKTRFTDRLKIYGLSLALATSPIGCSYTQLKTKPTHITKDDLQRQVWNNLAYCLKKGLIDSTYANELYPEVNEKFNVNQLIATNNELEARIRDYKSTIENEADENDSIKRVKLWSSNGKNYIVIADTTQRKTFPDFTPQPQQNNSCLESICNQSKPQKTSWYQNKWVQMGISAGLAVLAGYIGAQINEKDSRRSVKEQIKHDYNLPEQPADIGVGGGRTDEGSIGTVRGGRDNGGSIGGARE